MTVNSHDKYAFSICLSSVVVWSIVMSVYLITPVGVGNVYEHVHIGFLRRWASSECLEQIKADDFYTDCISIGPVR